MFLNLFDSHTHSENSPDADHSVTFMCEKAVQNGVIGFSLTDHCEMHRFEKDRFDMVVRQSFFDANRAKAAFGGKIVITAGIELGQPLQNREAAERVLSLYDFDFVLGSLHNSKGQEDFYFIDYTKNPDIPFLLESYYKELYETAVWNRFDSLAHITYPVRYLIRNNVPFDMSPYDDLIDETFKVLIHNGRALEMNTSGLRQGLGMTFPSMNYIKRYHELGGELITIGSDSHNAFDIGSGIADGMELLRAAGFQYFTFYKNRQPRMLQLV